MKSIYRACKEAAKEYGVTLAAGGLVGVWDVRVGVCVLEGAC